MHNEIAGNLHAALRAELFARGCKIYQSQIKVVVGAHCFYPDIIVRCGPRDGSTDIVSEPVLLAEVLSPSTQRYDQVEKWNFYQRLPSLQSFLMVEQTHVSVHLYRRNGTVWTYSSHVSLDDVIEFDDPTCSLRLADLYCGLEGIE